MARPQFTSPVERPADQAARETRVGSFSDESPNISSGVSGACRPIERATGTTTEDKLLDTVTFAVSQNSSNYTDKLPTEIYIEDADSNTLHQFQLMLGDFPLTFDPAYVVPAGGEVRIQFKNLGGSSVRCKAAVSTRPKDA